MSDSEAYYRGDMTQAILFSLAEGNRHLAESNAALTRKVETTEGDLTKTIEDLMETVKTLQEMVFANGVRVKIYPSPDVARKAFDTIKAEVRGATREKSKIGGNHDGAGKAHKVR